MVHRVGTAVALVAGLLGAVAREVEVGVDDEPFELSDMLGPWSAKPGAWAAVRAALRDGRFVHIRDALQPQLAEDIWREMNATDRWVFRSGFEPDYQFQGSSVMDADVRDRVAFESLNDLFDFLDAPEVKAPFAEAAGVSLGGPFQGFISLLGAGDHAAPHTDVHAYAPDELPEHERPLFPAGYRRAVAWVCHMSKDWDPSWGGDLVWTTPMTHITPRFNSLTLFPSFNDAWHFVQPVAAHAAKAGMPKRMSISGWWTTTDIAAGREREHSLSAGLCEKLGGCRRAFVGGDGAAVETRFGDPEPSPLEAADRRADATKAAANYNADDSSADHWGAAMRFDEAGDHAMTAVAFGAHARFLGRKDQNAHMNHGIALMRSGRLAAAHTAMQRALAIAPQDADVLENWGVLAEHMKRAEEVEGGHEGGGGGGGDQEEINDNELCLSPISLIYSLFHCHPDIPAPPSCSPGP